MKRSGLLCISCAIAFVLFGCATMPGMQGSETSIEDRARSVVAGLAAAYENRDVARLMTLVSAQYLQGYEDLKEALEDDLDRATSVSLTIAPERVWVEDDSRVFMDADWKKTISMSGSGAPEVTSGRVTFIFMRYDADVLKLFSQKGSPVFP